eukprot:5474395-Alexandrium_andersonii.AAC.1
MGEVLRHAVLDRCTHLARRSWEGQACPLSTKVRSCASLSAPALGMTVNSLGCHPSQPPAVDFAHAKAFLIVWPHSSGT